MSFNPSNAFAPYIDGPGLKVNVNGGLAVVNGAATSIAASSVTVGPNATTNIYLDQTTGLFVATTGNFPASGAYPVATAVSTTTGIQTLIDMRLDVFSASAGPLLSTVQVTPAQIKNLVAAPVTLIPAPGANKVIQVFTCFCSMIYSGVAYTSGGSPLLSIAYPGPVTVGSLTDGWPVSTTQDSMDSMGPASGYGNTAKSSIANQPIQLGVIGGVNFATGNSTIVIYTNYQIVSLQ